jgi:SAM-dependent methyltransferase
MNQPEFDHYAKTYDEILSATIPNGLGEDSYFAEYKIALMEQRLSGQRQTRILDFGCGPGRSLEYLDKYFPDAEIWGYDVSSESLGIASSRLPRAKLFSDWNTLGDTRFDSIVAANVFHHIPIDQRLSALKLCRTALTPDGQMFVFEHNPYNPLTRWIFERCPFDKDASMLKLKATLALAKDAGYRSEQHGYTLFFPRQMALFRKAEDWMRRLPVGAQYYVQMAR